MNTILTAKISHYAPTISVFSTSF